MISIFVIFYIAQLPGYLLKIIWVLIMGGKLSLQVIIQGKLFFWLRPQLSFLLATLLFPGLLDTPNGNEICTDAARNYCVVAEHFEMLFSIVQNISVAARVFKPAIMQR